MIRSDGPMPNSGDNFGPKENMLPSELAIQPRP